MKHCFRLLRLYYSTVKKHIKEALQGDFADKAELKAFVNKHLERMKTNAIKRKVRLMRKLGLQRWDYFVTFTYSDELYTEETFRNLSITIFYKIKYDRFSQYS